MNSNRDVLIANLESLSVFAERYIDLRCVNYDAVTGKKKSGYFSLVFSAIDTVDDRKVAIKFFDIDISVMQNAYRIKAFEREPAILQVLLGKERCLQLVTGLGTYALKIGNFDVPCQYFVVEWVDDSIEHFFDSQDQYSSIEKLKLFNEIVLGVEALHRHEIHHRDLKPDNLRCYLEALKRVVVAIDLGAAARHSTSALAQDYQAPVGANEYSAPETFCGMSGYRDLAHATDVYALGCLLYELFNKDLFVYEVRRAVDYNAVLAAMVIDLTNKPAEARLEAWKKNMNRFSRSIPSVSIDGPGTSVPASLRSILNDLVQSLTHFDFRKRMDLPRTRRLVWSAIRILENESKYQRRLEDRAQIRQRKIDKTVRLQEKLERRHSAQVQSKC